MKGSIDISQSQKDFIKKMKINRLLVLSVQLILFVLFISLWEFTAKNEIIDSFIFSSPSKILFTTINMTKDGSLIHHINVTLYETLLSFTLINLIGIFIATLLWLCRFLSAVIEPFLIVLNSIPKSALAPLLIVWLGNNTKTIIVAAVSVAVFGTIINIYTGFKEVDKDKIILIYTLGGTKFDALKRVIIPSTIPIILSSMKVNIGLSLVGVIIGEFLAANAGLGYLIIYGSQVFKLDMVILCIVLLCIIATVLYKILGIVEHFLDKFVSGR